MFYSFKYFFLIKAEKNITLKFAKLMIFVQQMSYNAPNRMFVFQKFSGGDRIISMINLKIIDEISEYLQNLFRKRQGPSYVNHENIK